MFKQIAFSFGLILLLGSCTSVRTDKAAQHFQETIIERIKTNELPSFHFDFTSGKSHNYPTFAIWLETTDGELIQTLFVTRSIASGYFKYGDAGNGKWLKVPGAAQRPAALPYWLHRREKLYENQNHLPSKDQPFPDAITGATPQAGFKLNVQSDTSLPTVFKVLVEVNQPWDWNTYYTNDKFPDNPDYRTSAQPSLVYAVTIDQNEKNLTYFLNPIGHGHPAGEDGQLFTDLRGFTTALDIFSNIQLQFIPASN